jgi:hypothetical protein
MEKCTQQDIFSRSPRFPLLLNQMKMTFLALKWGNASCGLIKDVVDEKIWVDQKVLSNGGRIPCLASHSRFCLVDDDVDLQELLKIRLESRSYEVSVASEGKEAQQGSKLLICRLWNGKTCRKLKSI